MPSIVDALRHRRTLWSGVTQLLYVVGGTALGIAVPMVTTGATIDDTVVTPMLFGAAGGFLSFIALVFSLLFLVVQYGNTTVSPRLTIFRDDPMVWHGFGYFAAVFAYCVSAGLRTGARGEDVTALVPALGLVLLLGALAMSRALQLRALRLLQFNAIMEEIRRRGQVVIEALYRTPFSSDEGGDVGPPEVFEVRWERPTALVRQIDLPALLAEAQRCEALIELRLVPGEEARRGMVVAVVRADHELSACRVTEALVVGNDRDFSQDPLLAFRLLTDISNRALSMAINDPATCVQGLGCIYDLLAQVVDKQLQLGTIPDSSGVPRVQLPFPSWEDFLAAAVDEIAHYGANDPTVRDRLRVLLLDLVALAPPERHAALDRRLEAVSSGPCMERGGTTTTTTGRAS